MDDEIRVTVIATGFDKHPVEEQPLPKMSSGIQAETARASVVPEPMPLKEEDVIKPEEESDPFDDIFKIFNKRD